MHRRCRSPPPLRAAASPTISTLVSARHADAGDLAALRLSPGAIVLCAVAVNVDPEGRPIQYAETRFAADRVELSVSTER